MGLASTPQHPPPPGIWRGALAAALHVDRAAIEPIAALRCTVGLAIPLVGAVLLNQQGAAIFMAVGAVSAGFGSFQGAYRSRAATMLCAAGGMAVSLFAGSLAGRSTVVDTALAGIWGMAAGLLTAVGPAAAFVGLQSTVAMLVAGAYPAPLGEAAVRALLVLCGGIIQTILVVSLWPLRRFDAERRVVGGIYRSLAEYAEGLPAASLVAPEPHTLADVGAVREDPQPFARSSEVLVFVALLDEAERIRAGLAALSLSPQRRNGDVPRHLAAVLREIAAAVEQAREPASLHVEWEALDAAAAEAVDGLRLGALVGQVRAAAETAAVPAIEEWKSPLPRARVRALPPLRDGWLTLRANLSMRSTAYRHGLRLAGAVALATAVYRLAALPRGYWFPMTTLLVLKPDYRATSVAAITRVVGTLAGAALAALLVNAMGSHPAGITALLLVAVWSGYCLFRANYTLFTICITGYIVLLLYLSGVPGPKAAIYRAVDTILGGLLALVVYRVWPTWEASHVRDVLATVADALARDADVLFAGYAEPSRWDPAKLLHVRATARRARSNAEASVDRLLGEPRSALESDLAISLLAAFRRYALGALALHAGLDQRPRRPRPLFEPLGREIAGALDEIARALRERRPANISAAALTSGQQALRAAGEAVRADQTDVMVESVTTIAALLSSYHDAGGVS